MLTKPNIMGGIISKVRSHANHHPLLRGMVSYAIIWPSSSIVQEYIEHGKIIENVNLARAARFGIFGTFFVAPSLYTWMKFTSRYFKGMTFKVAITRAAIEQVGYGPFAVTSFFIGMGLLESKPLATSVAEVREKFWPTYTTAFMFWPVAQTLNFYFIPERNRIIFVSAASFVWTMFLAHMKELPVKESEKRRIEQPTKTEP